MLRALGLSVRYRAVRPSPRVESGKPPGRLGSDIPSISIGAAVTAVRMATLVWPFRTTCLVRSLVLAQILREEGYPAEVVIGVRENGVGERDRFAHAWVEVRDGPGSPGFSELVRLVP